MINKADLLWGRYNGGQHAPVGTYINLRNTTYHYLTSAGALPKDGTWHRVLPDGDETATEIAAAVNAALSTSYANDAFTARGSGNVVYEPGQMVNDA